MEMDKIMVEIEAMRKRIHGLEERMFAIETTVRQQSNILDQIAILEEKIDKLLSR